MLEPEVEALVLWAGSMRPRADRQYVDLDKPDKEARYGFPPWLVHLLICEMGL